MTKQRTLKDIQALCKEYDLNIKISKDFIWICKTAYGFTFETNYREIDDTLEDACKDFIVKFQKAQEERKARNEKEND